MTKRRVRIRKAVRLTPREPIPAVLDARDASIVRAKERLYAARPRRAA